MTPGLLPLFPLPLVLFPGSQLPLHIFEPRYRRMLADCMAGDRRFGIVFRPASAGEEPPAPGQIGSVALVEHAETLPDGRSNIVVQGAERFQLDRLEERTTPYLMGSVSPYEDLPEPPVPLDALAGVVRALFTRVARAARALANDPDPLPPLPDDAPTLSFAIAALIDLEVEERQRLLASRSPGGRLHQLEAMLTSAVGALESRAMIHQRAKSNGAGVGAAI